MLRKSGSMLFVIQIVAGKAPPRAVVQGHGTTYPVVAAVLRPSRQRRSGRAERDQDFLNTA
ncbi:hypothetical protein WEH80_39735 [Actinomycetes bacterium KLBMP 9759]